MEDEHIKGLSINSKIIILILLFINIGFAMKMINKYYSVKDKGYMRERTFEEQTMQRLLRTYGSVEEMKAFVNDITQKKDAAEEAAEIARKKSEELEQAYQNLDETKSMLEAEKARLQRQIWHLEDSLSLTKRRNRALEEENAEFRKQLEEYTKQPEAWK